MPSNSINSLTYAANSWQNVIKMNYPRINIWFRFIFPFVSDDFCEKLEMTKVIFYIAPTVVRMLPLATEGRGSRELCKAICTAGFWNFMKMLRVSGGIILPDANYSHLRDFYTLSGILSRYNIFEMLLEIYERN